MTHDSAHLDTNQTHLRFSDLDIPPELKTGIKELGYVTPTDFQKGVFENFQNGRNVVGEGQSSYGKSLAFALPMLSKIVIENPTLQALIVCESPLLADICVKECRALSRHLGIVVGNSPNLNVDGLPHLLILSADDLLKCKVDIVGENLQTIFIDGLSEKNSTKIIGFLKDILQPPTQVLIFGNATLEVFKESAKEVIDSAAFVNNKDQPKITSPAKHIFVQAKEAEPKPRALLGSLSVFKPKVALVTCNEAEECDLLARYLLRYGFRSRVVSEIENRQGLNDALRDGQDGSVDVVICQNSLLSSQNLESVPFMFNYDMFDRAQTYEQATQFSKQAAGLERTIVNIVTTREAGLLGPIKAQCQIEMTEIELPSEEDTMDLCADKIRQALLKDASEIELTQFEALAKKIFDDKSAQPALSMLLRNYLLKDVSKPKRANETSDVRDFRDRDRRPSNRNMHDRRRSNDRQDRHERINDKTDRGERREREDLSANATNEINDIDDQPSKSSSAEGITRLYITLGRKDGLFDLASLAQYLSDKSGVDLGHFSGSGMIRDTSAHIEVDDDVALDIIKALHESPRPRADDSSEEPSLVVCERARQTTPRSGHYHRRPPQRRRTHFSRRP